MIDSNLLSDRIVTVDKLGFHIDRLASYSNGTAIFPITLELDLTTACSRHCPGCATILRPSAPALDQAFIHKLLSFFSVNTRGLLLAGGEPTLAPTFSTTLRSANQLGFDNIAVISNGAHLEDDRVIEALTRYATSVRISINNADPIEYGRSFGCDPSELRRILKALERLRQKVERDKSSLEIGVASLTQPNNAEELAALVRHARSSGAHWLYFHPYCSGWEIGEAAMVDQEAVLGYLKSIMSSSSKEFPIILFEERYAKTPVRFNSYHAAFFLLMIGADKKIYLGAETKYQRRYEIFDLSDWRGENFLNNANFRRSIHSFSSSNYRPLSSRGRGVLYSQIIDDLICGRLSEVELASKATNLNLKHVHIL